MIVFLSNILCISFATIAYKYSMIRFSNNTMNLVFKHLYKLQSM